MNSPSLCGTITLCSRRISSSGNLNYTNSILYDSGCDVVYSSSITGSMSCSIQLVNGNLVVIDVYGQLGTRDYVPSALMGFTSGSEWRVQARPVFANGVVGNYGTYYQSVKFKGTAAAMPTVESESDLEKSHTQRLR